MDSRDRAPRSNTAPSSSASSCPELPRPAACDVPADEFYESVYSELCACARAARRRWAKGEAVLTASLVHDALVRMQKSGALELSDRQHFLGYAARAMRSILVEKVIQHRPTESFDEQGISPELPPTAHELLELDAALERMARKDPESVRLVELRYFAGLKMQEVAEAMGISKSLAEKKWTAARLWLASAMKRGI